MKFVDFRKAAGFFMASCIFALILSLGSGDYGLGQAGQILTFRDIRYDSIAGVNPNLLSLDIYTSSRTGSRPVMIYVHGGGWSQGDKGSVGVKETFFVETGFVFVSINYRLAPAAEFPAHAVDVASAIAWVSENISAYGGDSEKILLFGHSAGAHLVALVATDGRYLEANRKDLSLIKAVVPLDTQAYDLNLLAEMNGGFLGAAYTQVFGTDREKWKAASPAT